MRIALLLLLGVLSCRRSHDPGDLYRSAVQNLRAGKLDAAAEQVARGIRELQYDRNKWYWTFRLLGNEVTLARGDAKKALAELVAEPPVTPEPLLAARWNLVLGNALASTGDYARADEHIREARRLIADGTIPEVGIEADVLEAFILSVRKQYALADALLSKAHDRAAAQDHPYWQTAALINQGLLRMKQSRYDEAVSFLENAVRRATDAGADRARGIAFLNLGICRYRLGNVEAARSDLEEAARTHRGTHDRRYLQATLGELGHVYALEGKLKQAIPYFEQAFTAAQELGATPLAAIWATNLSEVFAEVEDWDSAERWNERASGLRAKTGTSATFNLLNAALIAKGRQRYSDAEMTYSRALASAGEDPTLLWEAHAGMADLLARTGDVRKAVAHYQTALRQIEDSRADLLRTDQKVTFLSSVITFYQAYVEMLLNQGQSDKALDVVESSRARILLGESGAHARIDPRAVARSQSATFLSYWLAPRGSVLWVVSADRIRQFRLPPSTELTTRIEKYSRAIRDLADPLASEQALGRQLFDELVGPARPYLGKNPKVVIVPDGALHGLNFETLIADGNRYWIEEAEISVAPSLGAAARVLKHSATRSALLIGDAEAAGQEFPKLVHSAREVDAVARSLKGYEHSELRGAQAISTNYAEAAPARRSIIHFATHADANARNALESAIVLSPHNGSYKLYARDIASLPLSADLVTISSCRSAGAAAYAGEGLIGLAWAFLHAGARNVIAGLWDVNDRSTSDLMEAMYLDIAGGATYSAALRNAKLRLLASNGNFRKPYYWAPFLLYNAGLNRGRRL